MSAIVIENLSPQILHHVAERARLHHQSVEKEIIDIIEQTVNSATNIDPRRVIIDRIASMTPKHVQQINSTQIIREARDQWL